MYLRIKLLTVYTTVQYVLSYYDGELNHIAGMVEPGEGKGLHKVGVAGRRAGEGLHSVGVDGHGEGLCRVLFVSVCVCVCVHACVCVCGVGTIRHCAQ